MKETMNANKAQGSTKAALSKLSKYVANWFLSSWKDTLAFVRFVPNGTDQLDSSRNFLGAHPHHPPCGPQWADSMDSERLVSRNLDVSNQSVLDDGGSVPGFAYSTTAMTQYGLTKFNIDGGKPVTPNTVHLQTFG